MCILVEIKRHCKCLTEAKHINQYIFIVTEYWLVFNYLKKCLQNYMVKKKYEVFYVTFFL